MKTYRPARVLLAEVQQLLAPKPAPGAAPLEQVADLLCRGRQYSWVGIYLAAGSKPDSKVLRASRSPHPAQMARPETKSKVLISMKLSGREYGVLDVESERENAFGWEDRVLLENVANLLARFLAGPGKYLARHARELSPEAVKAAGAR